MNCQLENINVTQRDGRVTHLDRVYIRGSHVRLFIVPDMLKYEDTISKRQKEGILTSSQECAHVPVQGGEGTRCRSGKRKSDGAACAWSEPARWLASSGMQTGNEGMSMNEGGSQRLSDAKSSRSHINLHSAASGVGSTCLEKPCRHCTCAQKFETRSRC